MTVVNMISLGKEGIAVADEQASYGGRKTNTAEKLWTLGDGKAVYAGAGSASMIVELYALSDKNVARLYEGNPNATLDDIYQTVNSSLIQINDARKDDILRKNVSFSLRDLLTGTLSPDGTPLDQGTKQYAIDVLRNASASMNTVALVGGIQDDSFDVYAIDSENPVTRVTSPYISIGSGTDASDRVLSDYFDSLPKDSRNDIPLGEGLAKVIEAVNASEHTNSGVGGTPSIIYISQNGPVIATEQSGKVASELVIGLNKRFLKKKFVYPKLEGLILGDEKPLDVEEEMMSKAKNPEKFNRILKRHRE